MRRADPDMTKDCESCGREKVKTENFKFFSHKACEYFPCHEGINPEHFNCLFCYCPLYFVEECGGNYTFTKHGKKDCTNCILPHEADKFDFITDKLIDAINKSGQ